MKFEPWESLAKLNWIPYHQAIITWLEHDSLKITESAHNLVSTLTIPLVKSIKVLDFNLIFKFILVLIFKTLTLNIYKLGSPPSYSFPILVYSSSILDSKLHVLVIIFFILKNILFSIFIFILLLFLKIFYFYLYSILIFLFLFHFSYFYFSYFISLQIRT